MSKIVLLNSSFISKRKDYVQNTEAHFRSGIASLAAVARNSGHDVVILDPQVNNMDLMQLINRIIAEKPDYLGLPAYTEEVIDAGKIASRVKRRNRDIVTILGGQHLTSLPKQTLKEFGSIDIGCVGEGEATLKEILDKEPLENINGIVYRDNKGAVVQNPVREVCESLDDLPIPAWDLYDCKQYEVMPVEPLRGCPFDCVFCFRSLGKKVRYKSPKRIVDEIEHNIKNYGFKRFDLKSGTFPLSKEHCMKFCDELEKRGLDVEWIASTRVDTIDEETMFRMRQCGCDEISVGIESADERLLKQCGKGLDLQMAENVIKSAKKTNFKIIELNFILGLPYETKETLQATKRFALKMARYSTCANFAILTPFPATKVYEMAMRKECGLRMRTHDWSDFSKQSGSALIHENFKENELVRFQARLYLAYYLRSPMKIIKLFSINRCVGLLKKLFV